jgi:dTDP-4-amino-4,6-dideoxygalactose transaminase
VSGTPASLGGAAAFRPPLTFSKPTLEDSASLMRSLQEILGSGMLTDGPHARLLEERVAETFGVAHCVAVSSCSVGLMLVIQALQIRGAALLPSFTFSATAHSVRWNGLPIAFADCDPETWCLSPDEVYGNPALIVGVHVSGVPCDVEGLAKRAAESGAPLIFDAAHGAGSLVAFDGETRPLGSFGTAEVFSLTPTKVLSGAEGGLITTEDAGLAEHLRIARNYGNPGDYDTRFPGLNARLSELHAVVALASLDHLDERVARRNEIADHYRRLLSEIPGIDFQDVPPGARSSYKDFTILLDQTGFGCSRDAAVSALRAEGIPTRPYYSPPVHQQAAYRDMEAPPLPVTDRLAEQVISLPIWSHMSAETVERVAEALERIHKHAGRVEEWTQA